MGYTLLCAHLFFLSYWKFLETDTTLIYFCILQSPKEKEFLEYSWKERLKNIDILLEIISDIGKKKNTDSYP